MKKTLLICAIAAALTGCAEFERDRYYVAGYNYTPVCAQPINTCNTCHQAVTYSSCMPYVRPAPQPKTIVVMVPPAAPQPQPVIEHEIVYQPQPSCGCAKCGCNHNK